MSSQRGINGRDLDGKVQKRKNNSHQEEEPEPRTEPVSTTATKGKLEKQSNPILQNAPKKPRSSSTYYQSAEEYECRKAAINLIGMARAMANVSASVAEFALDVYVAEGIVAKEAGKFIIKVSSETATHHFDTQAMADQLLLFSDKNDNEWPMKLSVSQLQIAGRNQSFFHSKDVKVNDLIRFYKPVERFHQMHYLIQRIPYMFGKQLAAAEVTKTQLHICRADIEHFIHDKTGEAMVVLNRSIQLFDYENKSWEMKLVYYDKNSVLKITGSKWKEFTEKHKLKAGDRIVFYKASADGSHYLIRFDRVNA